MNESENVESWKLIHSGDGQLFTADQIPEIIGSIKSKNEPLEVTFFNIGFIAGLTFPIDKPKNGASPLDVVEYYNRAIGSFALKLLISELGKMSGDD